MASDNGSEQNFWLPILMGFIFNLTAALGSLFFSEIMKFPPCKLCWYQRIALFPLVVIFAVGFLRRDRGVFVYAAPFAFLGLAIAAYHNLLYYHVIPESLSPCTEGVSCTTTQIEWLGFITIPLLSLFAFGVSSVCLLMFKKRLKGIS